MTFENGILATLRFKVLNELAKDKTTSESDFEDNESSLSSLKLSPKLMKIAMVKESNAMKSKKYFLNKI